MGFMMSMLIIVAFPLILVIAYRYLDRISKFKTRRDKLFGLGASAGISLIVTTLLMLIVFFLIFKVVN